MLDALGGVLAWLGTSADDLLGGAVLWLIDLLISFLPLSPFLGVTLQGLPAQALGWLNYFVNVRGMCDLMGLWLLCVTIYMALHAVLHVVHGSEELRKLIGHTVNPLSGGD